LGKLIETYRAIDTGTEIKLLMGNGSMLNDITLDKSSWSIKTKNDKSVTSLVRQLRDKPFDISNNV